MPSYDPDGFFIVSALFRLEDINVPVISSLNTKLQALQQILGTYILNTHTYTDPISLLKAWLSHGLSSSFSPSWKNLLLIVGQLNLDDLAQKMEACLSQGADQEDRYSDSGISEPEVMADNEAGNEG